MKKNPLIVQLTSLTRKEMTRFEAFAASPYFNKHKDLRQLVAYLSEIYPDFSEKKCDRATVYQKLYPGIEHDQAQLAIVFSYATRLLELFLVVEALKEEGNLNDKSLFYKQLRKRGLNQFLSLDWESSTAKAPQLEIKAATIPKQADKSVLQTVNALSEKDAVAVRIGLTGTEYLLEKQSKLAEFYLEEALKDACELWQRAIVLKKAPPKLPLLDNLFDAANYHPDLFDVFPKVKVYQVFFHFLKNGDSEVFEQCAGILQVNENLFDKEALQSLYNYLQNFCIQQINKGERRFLKELFNLYKRQLDNQLLFEEGILPEWHYKNIVTTGLRLEEVKWVREFIEQYSASLPGTVAGNAYSYNLAAWYYHIGKPSEVLPLLLQVEYTDLRYNLDAKSLLLRTYFDLGEEGALFAHAEAFQQFVKRNKSLTEFQKKGYSNLVRFTLRSFKLKQLEGYVKVDKWKTDFQKLKNDMAEEPTLFNRTWLESKLEELAKN